MAKTKCVGLTLMALLAGLSVLPIRAQQIVWEKKWGFFANDDVVSKIIQEENSSNFLALGKSTKWSQSVGNGFFESLILQKIDENGDTLFLKRLGTVPVIWPVYLGHKFGNIYQAVIQSPLNDNNLPVGYPCILEFTDEGQLLSTQYLTAYPEYRPNTCIKTADGGLILAGYYNGALSAPTNMMAIKVNFLGQVEWGGQYFPPVITRGVANRIEPMPNGNFLLSGTMGRRIYGFEIDSTGNPVNQKTYYETPSNRVFTRGSVAQNWRNTFFSIGDYDSSTTTFWRRKLVLQLKNASGQKIWGGETVGNAGPFFLNREHSIVYSNYNGQVNRISRIRADSSVIWHLNLSSNSNELKVMNDMIFSQNDTGIAVGSYVDYSNNFGQQFWIAKIAGVGTAYDPSNPQDTVTVSAEERHFRPKDSPVLYPNPATETIRFQKLSQETKVAIYSSQGQKLLEQWILPEQAFDVCTLPVGAYLYHLKMGERVFTGRFWKK